MLQLHYDDDRLIGSLEGGNKISAVHDLENDNILIQIDLVDVHSISDFEVFIDQVIFNIEHFKTVAYEFSNGVNGQIIVDSDGEVNRLSLAFSAQITDTEYANHLDKAIYISNVLAGLFGNLVQQAYA